MKAILMVALVATMALAGCGSKQEFVVPEQDDQGRYIVKMLSSQRFSPEKIEIPVGSTVVWINEGGVHNTESYDSLWMSQLSGDTGEHFSFTFETEGDFRYFCDPHETSGMIGTVRVVAAETA